MKRVVLCVVAVSVLLAGALPAAAGDGEQQAVQTHLKRVALFKNGFAFFVREGTLTDARKAVLLGPFAAPAHGTFWVSTPSRAQLASVIAREVMVPRKIEARTTYELLRANVGKSVVLSEYGSGLSGTILSFAQDRPPARRPGPYAMGPGSGPAEAFPSGLGDYMLLDTPAGIVALAAREYGQVRFASKDIGTTFLVDEPQLQLEASFNAPSRGEWLSVSYLARGITWAPSYLIDISDPKQARLSAKAEIINEAEDLDGTHVDLVTGFPHLQFADIMSPIGKKEGLAQFLQSLSRGPSRRPEDVASVMTQAAYAGESARPTGPTPDYGAAAAGQVLEDLFLYPLENVSLAKNETGYYPLFTETLPYTEFYEWRVPDYLQEGYFSPSSPRGEELPPEVVWHSLRLTNTMTMPWTTAPAQLTKDGQLLSQDTLKYTPPTAQATVKITKAMGIKADQVETETNRDPNPVYRFGRTYERVTITGTLQVANYTAERVPIEIVKTLSGTVMKTSPQAGDVTLARGMSWVNPTHELTWKIELKPGDSREITYTYQALIRR
jgi:hypothetical protein